MKKGEKQTNNNDPKCGRLLSFSLFMILFEEKNVFYEKLFIVM